MSDVPVCPQCPVPPACPIPSLPRHQHRRGGDGRSPTALVPDEWARPLRTNLINGGLGFRVVGAPRSKSAVLPCPLWRDYWDARLFLVRKDGVFLSFGLKFFFSLQAYMFFYQFSFLVGEMFYVRREGLGGWCVSPFLSVYLYVFHHHSPPPPPPPPPPLLPPLPPLTPIPSLAASVQS